MKPLCKAILLLHISIYSIYCNDGSKVERPANPVADEVVLSVGNIQLTSYELKKNLDIFKNNTTTTNKRPPTKSEIKKWMDDFVMQRYFLADAEVKGYYQRADVVQAVENMESFILSQSNGPLEQVLLQGLTPEFIKVELEKSKKSLILEFIMFKDKASALKTIDANQGTKDWNSILKRSAEVGGVVGNDVFKWPFDSFWSNVKSILTMKKGEVSSLFNLGGPNYYLVFVKDIAVTEKPAINESQMVMRLRSDILGKYYEGIRMRSNITVNQSVLQQISDFLKHSGPTRFLDKADFREILNKEIIHFNSAEGESTHVSLEYFIDYYNSLPVQQYLADTKSVESYLHKIAYDSYIRIDAARLGVTNDLKFILDKKNYMNSLVYRKYEEHFLKDTALISQSEIEQTYHRIKSQFVLPAEVLFSMFSFKNVNDAFISRNVLQKTGVGITKLQNVLEEKRHLKLDFRNKDLPDSLKHTLFAMRLAQVSHPIMIKGTHILLVKESEAGKRQQELDEVKDLVIQEIRKQRLEANKREKFTKLCKIYQKQGAI